MKKCEFETKKHEILHKNIAFRLLFDPEHIPQPGELIWGRPGAVPKLEVGFWSVSIVNSPLEAFESGLGPLA